MEIDYGQLQNIVAIAGSVMAAGTSIGLAWMRRAKWMPPEETVAGGTVKVSALICSVILGVLFLIRFKLGLELMLLISGISILLTLIALGVSIYTNTTYSFIRREPSKRRNGMLETRVLGGYKLTDEALAISQRKNMGHQQLYENANYKDYLVWTRQSLAIVQVASTMGFIALQTSGSIALSSMAIAFSLTT